MAGQKTARSPPSSARSHAQYLAASMEDQLKFRQGRAQPGHAPFPLSVVAEKRRSGAVTVLTRASADAAAAACQTRASGTATVFTTSAIKRCCGPRNTSSFHGMIPSTGADFRIPQTRRRSRCPGDSSEANHETTGARGAAVGRHLALSPAVEEGKRTTCAPAVLQTVPVQKDGGVVGNVARLGVEQEIRQHTVRTMPPAQRSLGDVAKRGDPPGARRPSTSRVVLQQTGHPDHPDRRRRGRTQDSPHRPAPQLDYRERELPRTPRSSPVGDFRFHRR